MQKSTGVWGEAVLFDIGWRQRSTFYTMSERVGRVIGSKTHHRESLSTKFVLSPPLIATLSLNRTEQRECSGAEWEVKARWKLVTFSVSMPSEFAKEEGTQLPVSDHGTR